MPSPKGETSRSVTVLRTGLMTQSWLIGSNSDCELIVDSPTVSGHHCRLTRERDGFVLEDLGSTNGTFVNGVRIGTRTRVAPRDVITLGLTAAMPWPKGDPSASARVLRIGREPDNDYVVNLPTVSGYHARVMKSA
jgi:pSer/pThr/pTyr-binding forkhead associated (FHA) protein